MASGNGKRIRSKGISARNVGIISGFKKTTDSRLSRKLKTIHGKVDL